MAELEVEGTDLVLHLTTAEKLEALHSDLKVPLTAVRGVEVLDDAHGPADSFGFKTGTRIPGVVEVATVRTSGQKIFAAVHRDTPRGVRVVLEGSDYDEWIVGSPDPEALVAGLSLPGSGLSLPG